MGWSCSWIAVRSKSESSLFSTLGMQRTGRQEEMPESPWTVTVLPYGWTLVFCSNHCSPSAFKDSSLETISIDCELVCSSVEEHVMFSSTSYWRNGSKVWSVTHDNQNGLYDLQSSGQLPTSFDGIRENYFTSQRTEGGEKAGVDLIFDIPLHIGVELTGFRHDESAADEESPYEVLAFIDEAGSALTNKKPWWRLW